MLNIISHFNIALDSMLKTVGLAQRNLFIFYFIILLGAKGLQTRIPSLPLLRV